MSEKICINQNPDDGAETALGSKVLEIACKVAAFGTSPPIPDFELVIAGPIAAGLADIIGFAGGVIGALVGTGIPKEKLKLYESEIKKGNVVIGVQPHNEAGAVYFKKNWKSA